MAQIIHLRFPVEREPDTWARQPEPEPTETDRNADRVMYAFGACALGVWTLAIIELLRSIP
jgi:hypothetical protein